MIQEGRLLPVSTLDTNLDAAVRPVITDDLELTRAREAVVGDMTVRRLLPLRLRRSVGAWCFIDHYGPMSVDGVTGMAVPPHPHIGLQTVTWLMAGNVLHRDSLGSEQMIRPGQLNLMTAGRGIAHAEESPAEHDVLEGADLDGADLHGVQLWVALPDASRLTEPVLRAPRRNCPSPAPAASPSPSCSDHWPGCDLRRPRSPTSSARSLPSWTTSGERDRADAVLRARRVRDQRRGRGCRHAS